MSVPRSSRRWIARVALVACAAIAISALGSPFLGGAATLKLPEGVSKRAALRMYAEQLDDQSNITQLIEGDVASFEITDRKVAGDSAELTLKVTYSNGLERRGYMRLFEANKNWFFSSIASTRDRKDLPPAKSADIGVLNTVLAEQVEHATLTEQLVNGTYKTIALGKPKPGYRSVEIPVTFSGGKGRAKVAGRVTCIRKVQAGAPVWFVTGFAQ